MATGYLLFRVLDVGQGSGNFIEIYDTKGKLSNTILIDLGSEKAKDTAGGPSVEYVVAKLKTMAQPTIDTVILSHSDSDHINLVQDLLKAFDPVGTPGKLRKNTLQIDVVRYGGDSSKYKKTKGANGQAENVLTRLGDYAPGNPKVSDIDSFKPSYTSLRKAGAPFRTVNGVKLYVMMGNAAREDDGTKLGKKRKAVSDSYALNTNSLVIMLSFRGKQIIATGDATGVTLQQANRILTSAIIQAYLPSVLMLTMPHHSSKTTTLDVKGATGTKAERDKYGETNLENFADNTRPNAITASADRKGTFRHPSALVMSYFWDELMPNVSYTDPLLPQGSDRHFYSAYFNADDGFQVYDDPMLEDWPPTSNWYTVQTDQNIYVNLYAKPAEQRGVLLPPDESQIIDRYPSTAKQPPAGVAWVFRINNKGAVSVTRQDNRAALLALRRAIYSGVPPSELPEVTLDEEPEFRPSPPRQQTCQKPEVVRQSVPAPVGPRSTSRQAPLSRRRNLSILA